MLLLTLSRSTTKLILKSEFVTQFVTSIDIRTWSKYCDVVILHQQKLKSTWKVHTTSHLRTNKILDMSKKSAKHSSDKWNKSRRLKSLWVCFWFKLSLVTCSDGGSRRAASKLLSKLWIWFSLICEVQVDNACWGRLKVSMLQNFWNDSFSFCWGRDLMLHGKFGQDEFVYH